MSAHIPDHATSAHLERLLMRWPMSIRLKLALKEAREREAREAERAARALRGQIRKALMSADIRTLKNVAAELTQLEEVG